MTSPGPAAPSAPGRLAALALLSALLFVLWAVVVRPATERAAELAAEIEVARDLAAAYEARLAADGAAAPEAAGLDDEKARRGDWLPGATPALAAAGIRRRIAAIAAAEGAEIRSTQDLPAPTNPRFATAALRVALEGAYEPVLRALHRIETEAPLLTVDRLTLRPLDGVEGARVMAEIDLSGLLAPELPE